MRSRFRRRAWRFLAIALLSVGGSGCAAKQPALLDPDFQDLNLRRIALLLVIDRRPDRSLALNEPEIRYLARKELQDRGYVVSYHEQVPSDEDIASLDVAAMQPVELAQLVPEGEDAAIVLFLDDSISSYKVMWYSAKVEMTASLISKSGREVWRGKGVGSGGQAGLASGMLKDMILDNAIDFAIHDLLASLPEVDSSEAAAP